jgi:hypothetical protein
MFLKAGNRRFLRLGAAFEQEDAEKAEFLILPSLFPLRPPVHLSALARMS